MEPETAAGAPPEARLVRTARLAAGMTAAQAAVATNGAVSATYWRDVERGRGGRRGQQVPVRASARLLAVMARLTGVTPEQLDGAQREDAARVLREIQRREDGGGPEGPPVPRNPFASVAGEFSEPEDDFAWVVFPDPADRLFRMIWRKPYTEKERVRKVAELRAAIRRALEPPGRESAGLPAPDGNDPGTGLNSP
ncbi:MAG TPA: hypothetical protein VK599_03800 [Streptosporangiaceae bacterium]|nr:hypothetical protein [Streptosporangiaceae bacterium]